MIEILKTGGLMRIVDLGRSGYKRYGVPVGGAMDMASFLCAQTIVGNPINTAALELYESGHKIKFKTKTTISITGADGDTKINGKPTRHNEAVPINIDDVLSVGKMLYGCRIYITIAGGLDTKVVLGSSSHLQGIHDATLRPGMRITMAHKEIVQSKSRLKPHKIDLTSSITCSSGPEYNLLNDAQKDWITNTPFTIANQSNTMGYRVNGQKCPDYNATSINTSAIIVGTVQLPSDGLPIILMRDAQTTGGYPRILVISEYDLNQLAQRRPGDKVKFEMKATIPTLSMHYPK